jgi:hypothetical protein
MNYSEDSEEDNEMEKMSLQAGSGPAMTPVEPLSMEPILDVWRCLRDYTRERHLHLLDDPVGGETLYEIFCTKM